MEVPWRQQSECAQLTGGSPPSSLVYCTRMRMSPVCADVPMQVIFRQMEVVGGEAPDRALLRKITPSLVTLLAAEPEIQCVWLLRPRPSPGRA